MKIVHYPHPALRHESKSVKRVDAELRRAVREMFELMYEAKGVGLAANQVDLPLRLFVLNLAADPEEGEELVFINPVLSLPRGTDEAEEGCLSIPGYYGTVRRPKEVRINAYSLSGEEIQVDASGLFARVVQHENDHLDGVLFVDRLSEGLRAEADQALDELELEFTSLQRRGEIPDEQAIRQRLDEWEQRYC